MNTNLIRLCDRICFIFSVTGLGVYLGDGIRKEQGIATWSVLIGQVCDDCRITINDI